MKACQGCRQSFTVPGQATEARGPGKTALHHSPARQQHEAVLGLREFHDFQVNAMRRGGLGGVVSGISLVNKSDVDRLSCDSLYLDPGSKWTKVSGPERAFDSGGSCLRSWFNYDALCSWACAPQ
jgi:hypothetical protein